MLTSLGVTSIDAFELIVSVEERFGFEFDDQELNPGLVDPLKKLVTAVSSKLKVAS
jgi:acyl carrier protein